MSPQLIGLCRECVDLIAIGMPGKAVELVSTLSPDEVKLVEAYQRGVTDAGYDWQNIVVSLKESAPADPPVSLCEVITPRIVPDGYRQLVAEDAALWLRDRAWIFVAATVFFVVFAFFLGGSIADAHGCAIDYAATKEMP